MSTQTSIILGSLIVAVCSYLLGSISWSVIVSKLIFHKDVRDFGSGNAGMTNVLRTFGKGAAALVTVGDFSKSILTVAVSRGVFAHLFGTLPFDIGYIAGIFTILGHLFPLYFHFKGGKGVLTALGMILVINPIVFLVLVALCIPLLFICKIVSVASITGAIVYPIVTFIVLSLMNRPAMIDTVFSVFIGLLVVYMHRVNIKRLINGTEYKFGKPKEEK
ncbi:glycerol-3-phosphate acyltransferase PlsY [Hydrogenoanaerobacterium saccharovorans]|uniref:Glycerol-3-phosphate acyltransferase n=1 Tax=Hydrogenoanaerobacterium saccharovorans TaxID=474960 RepID=A0A1H8D547_9FIRM|nr:glycerol-3-phosphate 1-O-acyltransferase PlsY [Hydrogenoanaerobacterium saccharovorans]RPF43459.1 glycerol-3-phosphate acyltransferase PlsY [Hydrogenoanaerobacterium saccharovorans]SEN01617.1 glycerol-3-phosphate acyltransferase PlsY [Hydrogenoanaerobacterium saccharovorans]